MLSVGTSTEYEEENGDDDSCSYGVARCGILDGPVRLARAIHRRGPMLWCRALTPQKR